MAVSVVVRSTSCRRDAPQPPSTFEFAANRATPHRDLGLPGCDGVGAGVDQVALLEYVQHDCGIPLVLVGSSESSVAQAKEEAGELAIALVQSLTPGRTVEILGGSVFGFGGHS